VPELEAWANLVIHCHCGWMYWCPMKPRLAAWQRSHLNVAFGM
jgi:hypothetical protein